MITRGGAYVLCEIDVGQKGCFIWAQMNYIMTCNSGEKGRWIWIKTKIDALERYTYLAILK